ncbi:ABC transporter substrate-binding protein [Geoalkalibacter sp.]|uniref:ABC transporter substrate-binding protein n=1 Tax=Geoalkalibacter sp. TaxID=3041440 RepID=UPI00272DCF0B|nr:helical backbone metal receptor [Geoalkalibacter sp.]
MTNAACRRGNKLIFFGLIGLLWLVANLGQPAWGMPQQRIVSLAPALTELLFALGFDEQIVGVSAFCDHPSQARQRPSVGGMANPSLEAIVALKPDLVVMTTDGNSRETAERLEAFGIRTLIFRTRRLLEMPAAFQVFGEQLGVPGAANALAQDLQNSFTTYAAAAAHSSADKRKALFVIWPEPLVVAGPATLIDDALTLLGVDNIAADTAVAYPRFSLEEALRRAPQVVIFGSGRGMEQQAEGLLQQFSTLPSAQNLSVCFVGDALYRSGPRLGEGLAELVKCLTPRDEAP